jgi:hypothetical protein
MAPLTVTGGNRGWLMTEDQTSEGPASPAPAIGPPGLLQALTTEHFTLQTARSATIADSNGRSALYLSTVSGAVVALAFIGQIAKVGQPFFLFALALLPALFFLGVLTYLRLLQSAIEDLFYARAINRIRRYYLGLGPEAARWFLLAGHDDPAGAMASMGLPATRRHLLSHTATMVAVVASIIGGAFVALATGALGAAQLPVAASAAVGVLVALASTALFWHHQTRRWHAAEQAVQPLFPSPTPPSDLTPHRRPDDLPEGSAQ